MDLTFFETIETKLKDLQAQIRVEGEIALKEGLRKFFEEFPEVNRLTWTQYTPGFNDGDPCEFTISELYFEPTVEGAQILEFEDFEPEEEDEENYDEWCDAWSLTYENKHNVRANELAECLQKFQGILQQQSMEHVLESIFGNYVRIIARKDKVTTESYDCGY